MDRNQLIKCSLYVSIVAQASFFALGLDYNGPLVQYDENGIKKINPLFNDELMQDIYYLLKRSYMITTRVLDRYDYVQADRLQLNELRNFGKDRNWFCLKACVGTQGDENRLSHTLLISGKKNMEVDYPCFVALKLKTEANPYHIIAIVFRGSQSNSFESLKGFGGPSWLTNLAAQKSSFEDSFNLQGLYHRGFLEKYESVRISLFSSLLECFNLIPMNEWQNTKIVITGHSQGGGLAFVSAMDIVQNFCTLVFDRNYNNKAMNKVYLMGFSSPNVFGNKQTKELFNAVFSKDNAIRYASPFDPIPYSCPGQKAENNTLSKNLLKALFGFDSGFISAGHLALSNTKDLLFKGLERCNRFDIIDHVPYALESLIDCYKNFLSSLNSNHQLIDLSKASYNGYNAINEIGGFMQFIAINHFGSNKYDESQFLFDPTLPETNLNNSLFRGHLQNSIVKMIKNKTIALNVNQPIVSAAIPFIVGIRSNF